MMKRNHFAITALAMAIVMSTSCSKEMYELHIEVVIENQSSSQVAGGLIGESAQDGFNLAPNESHEYSFVTESESKSLDPSFSIGPRELEIDGKTYYFKSTDKANDFFDLYGWVISSTTGGYTYKVTLTDEGLANLIKNAG